MDIELKGITKRYQNKIVFKDYNLIIPEGKITCIMGKSGCGKTTLLNLLMRLTKPDYGEIKNVPSQVAAVFQEDRLCEEVSVLSNLQLVAPKVSVEAIHAILSQIGMAESIKVPVKELSGGMKRRVAIVRALLAAAKLVLLDEPLKGLDDGTKEAVVKLILSMTEGKTVVLVTHDMKEACAFGNRVVEMSGEER